MKRIIILFAAFFLFTSIVLAADINEYKGTWVNTNENTREVTKLVFEIVGGGKANVHVWGQCSPQDCDWGWSNCNSFADGHLTTRYTNDFSVRDLTITKTGTITLELKVHTRYTDDSGRPTRDSTETFRKLLTPVQKTPRPLKR